MTGSPVLRTRQARDAESSSPALPTVRQGPAPDLWEQAAQLSRAREILPKAYAANPGTVWLVLGWAAAQGVDPLTAIYGVSFVNNRPVVDARLQSALAERAGYRVKVEHADAESATVAVLRDGELLGRTTYTMDDARRAGLAGRENYKRHPRRMLVARARTEAISFHAPSVGVGLAVDDDPFEVDGVAVVEDAPGVPPSTEPAPAQAAPEPEPDPVDDVTDAEIVEPAADPEPDPEPELDPVPEPEPPAVEEPPKVTPSVQRRADARAAVERIKAAGRYAYLVGRMGDEGIPLAQSKWTAEQSTRIVELADQVEQTTATEEIPE